MVSLESSDPTGTRTCVESKCVSRALSDLHNGSFTCYGDDGAIFPRMCADGFLPVIVADEPPLVTDVEKHGNLTLSYYTCCPPSHKELPSSESTTDAIRHCSDPIVSETETDAVCDSEETRKYPRPMKPNVAAVRTSNWPLKPTKSFLCCDNESDGDTGNRTFLGDTECVPYRSPMYDSFEATNELGVLRPISCDFPEGSFRFARPLDGDTFDTVVSTGRYQCCTTGPALPPFVKDPAFELFVYPFLFLASLAAVVSAVVAVALLIPLFAQLCDGTYYRRTAQARLRRSPHDTRSSITSNETHQNSRAMERAAHRYSTYNLYLVYLAVFDLAYFVFIIWYLVSYINQKNDPVYPGPWLRVSNLNDSIYLTYDKRFSAPYVFANLYINCIIAHQILALLRSSRRFQRLDQPSLTTVNLQLAIGISIAVTLGLFLNHLFEKMVEATICEDYERVKELNDRCLITVFVGMVLPTLYAIGVSILIWWRGDIPSENATTRAKGMRELAFYFYRIAMVFLLIWIPMVALQIYGVLFRQSWCFVMVAVMLCLQPLLTTGVILTKSDARGYILDFCSLVCFACRPSTKDLLPPGGAKHQGTSGFDDEDAVTDAVSNGDANANAKTDAEADPEACLE